MRIPKFGLNRNDASSVATYAKDVTRAESCGWDAAWLPDSQLRRRDTYVLLAAAAEASKTITIGPLLTNPITRHPSVTASSISTVAELAEGRTVLTYGAGDTAVRLAGLEPARVTQLHEAVELTKSFLDGNYVEVGADRPAKLPFAQPVPVWVAAGGPRTLKMAGAVADGVFIRVGTHSNNILSSIKMIWEGAEQAGRDRKDVKLGIIFHTVLHDHIEQATLMAKSMAAGYFEYSPVLFENLGYEWNGADPEELKASEDVWPDFHHSSDLVASGNVVNFISAEQARSFALVGGSDDIFSQLIKILFTAAASGIEFDHVVLHPIPNPPTPDEGPESYLERVPREILPAVRKALSESKGPNISV
tara:strand:+ start:4745 stop:5830 length:1086 start_codon:yes stop_codon:yes gene_type:complete